MSQKTERSAGEKSVWQECVEVEDDDEVMQEPRRSGHNDTDVQRLRRELADLQVDIEPDDRLRDLLGKMREKAKAEIRAKIAHLRAQRKAGHGAAMEKDVDSEIRPKPKPGARTTPTVRT